MRITVDPSTEAGGFGYADAGRYELRIAGCEQKQKDGGEFPYLNWKMEFVDPNIQASDPKFKVGMIFEITTLKPTDNAQFKLRQLCEACGVVWGDFDTDELIGATFEAELGHDEYNGTIKNVVKKYIPKG